MSRSFSDCVEKKPAIKCDGDGAAEIRRRRNWPVDDFDDWKFDSAEIYTL